MTETTQELPPIRGFLPSTLIDWPGRIASMVFLPACNLRCAYCHAGPLLEPGSTERIPADEVLRYLRQKRDWIDGVVICGGEPTLHGNLDALCRALHEVGVAVKLDTNGTRPDVVQRLIAERLVDAVSMDIKTALDGRMVALARCEIDLDAIERTVDLLLATPAVEAEFRTTCCPAFVDTDEVEWIARRIASAPRQPAADYVLQRFEPQHAMEPEMRTMAPYGAGKMEELLAAARRHHARTRLRSA